MAAGDGNAGQYGVKDIPVVLAAGIGQCNAQGGLVVGFIIPASGVAGTALTFDDAGDTGRDIHGQDGTELSLTIAAGRFVQIDPWDAAALTDFAMDTGNAADDGTITVRVRMFSSP
jgi:hypothetical protein